MTEWFTININKLTNALISNFIEWADPNCIIGVTFNLVVWDISIHI